MRAQLTRAGPREGEGEDGGPTHREFMLKPWMDAVTHRLLLRCGTAGTAGRAGDGGKATYKDARGRGGVGGGSEGMYQARWLGGGEEETGVMRFRIVQGGIEMLPPLAQQ
jgi:hypothetical protein